MKISVLTITRNDNEGLKRTIESVRGQRPTPGLEVEHVVVDGSDAAIAEEARALCGPETVYLWSAPEGIYPAMNRALQASTGDVIGILNGGDILADDRALERVARALTDPAVDFTLSDVIFHDSARYYSGDRFSIASMEQGMAPPHPSLYARRKVYDAMGPYNEDFQIVADFDFFARLAKDGRFRGTYIEGPLVEMERGGTSQTIFHRLWRNTVEKHRSLKLNGLRAGWLRLYCRFFVIIYTQFILRHNR